MSVAAVLMPSQEHRIGPGQKAVLHPIALPSDDLISKLHRRRGIRSIAPQTQFEAVAI
jgi:hypothetical protein